MMTGRLFSGVTAIVCMVLAASCGGGAAGGVAGAGSGGMSSGAAGSVTGAGGSSSDGAGGAAGVDGGMGDTLAGAAGTTGAAGAGVAGISGAALTATWTFPSMIKTGTTTVSFPTYVSHLLGKMITEPLPTDFACVSISNSGSAAAIAHVEVSLGTYGPLAAVDVSVPAQATQKTCLTPTFNKSSLYALTAPDSSTLATTANDSNGANIGSTSMVVTIPPVDDIAWSANGIDPKTLKEMATVYVEPNALDIDKLQRSAQVFSVFPTWNGAYERDPYSRTYDVPPSNQPVAEDFVVESAEAGGTFQWQIQSVTCSLCADPTVTVAIFTSDQWTAFMAGTSTTATAVWMMQGGGAPVGQVLGAAGQYIIAFFNPASNFVDRTVTWTRSVTREDIVRDVLLSTFSALRAAHLTYSTVTNTFFSDWQHVRRVTQSLEAASANCIDGSFVFASVAELLGMQPVLFFKTGHAFMGIRSSPSSRVIWPIETTQVGATTSPFAAYVTAINERAAAMGTDPLYQEVDVATLRSRGVTPLVQQ